MQSANQKLAAANFYSPLGVPKATPAPSQQGLASEQERQQVPEEVGERRDEGAHIGPCRRIEGKIWVRDPPAKEPK